MENANNELRRASTGISGLDEITHGGLPEGEIYLVNGAPGTGKTILGLNFLEAGVQAGEKVLCITLCQRLESLEQMAASVGTDTRGMIFEEFTTAQAIETTVGQQQTVFDTSEIELEETMTHFTQVIEAVQPQRVLFDGISYLRILAHDIIVYRRNLLLLQDYLCNRNITVLLTNVQEVVSGDHELVSIVHGIITLSKLTTNYGQEYRHIQLSKMRGSGFHSGIHDMEITDQGMKVYPLPNQSCDFLIDIYSSYQVSHQPISSGVESFDKLLGGSLLTGTSCLIMGPSGTGKTTLGSLFVHNFIRQGGKASVFLFDELATTFLERSRGLQINLDPSNYSDKIRIRELGLSNSSPGKFTYLISKEVNEWGAKVVFIDSLTGYANFMPSNNQFITQLHDLLITLNQQNVLTILVVAQHGIIGNRLK